ncbi:MAG TPA: kelch repeat-containing protein, partial [Chitinophagales bacterium]|nr:kelch repeat-containing protein [Chitinophagales bacterium]
VGMIGFSIDGIGYAGLGYGVAGGMDFKNDIWQYNPVSDTWTQKNDFGGAPRSNAVVFVINGNAYVGTGEYLPYCYADFWKYDPAQDSWTPYMNFPGATRRGGIAFSINGKGYVGGGRCYINSFYNDFWEYDPTTNVWTQKADIWDTARYNCVGFAIGNKGYAGLGWGANIEHDLREYDPATDTWTQKSDFAGEGRNEAAAFVIGDKAYVGLGWINGVGFGDLVDAVFFNDFYSYTPDTETSVNALVEGASVSLYPNPSYDETTVHLRLARFGDVTVDVIDLVGRVLQTGVYESQPAGAHSYRIDIKAYLPGVYLIKVSDGVNRHTLKLIKQ